MKRVKDLSREERPREKLAKKGPQALSDVELIAILLGRGIEGHDVMSVAKQVLNAIDSTGGTPDCTALQNIAGMGPAKATLIAAALEFARRRIKPEGFKINFPAAVLPLIQHYTERKQGVDDQ
jgi:DNA repair protein RadC